MLCDRGHLAMRRLCWTPASVGLLVCLFCVLDKPAHAYLDPGTGTYLLQLAAAALFAGLFTLKAFWARITGRGKASAEPTPAVEQPETAPVAAQPADDQPAE